MQVEDIIIVSQYRNSLHLRQQWVAASPIKFNNPDKILDCLFCSLKNKKPFAVNY